MHATRVLALFATAVLVVAACTSSAAPLPRLVAVPRMPPVSSSMRPAHPASGRS